MAIFTTYAEVVTPDHPLTRSYEEGVAKSQGLLLQDVLQSSGGAYEMKVGLSRRFRDQARRLGELTSDETLLQLADLSEVTVSLENLRYADPRTTRVAIGYRIMYTKEESEILSGKR